MYEIMDLSSTPLHCMTHSSNPMYYSSQWREDDSNQVVPRRDSELNSERKKSLDRENLSECSNV